MSPDSIEYFAIRAIKPQSHDHAERKLLITDWPQSSEPLGSKRARVRPKKEDGLEKEAKCSHDVRHKPQFHYIATCPKEGKKERERVIHRDP